MLNSKFSTNKIIEECESRSNDCTTSQYDSNENFNNSQFNTQKIP